MNPKEEIQNAGMKTLAELRKGQTATEFSAKLQELVAEIAQTGRPGEIKLIMKIKPNRDGETVSVIDTIEVKHPKADWKTTTFFATEDNLLVRDNPKQRELFRTVHGKDTGEEIADEAINQ